MLTTTIGKVTYKDKLYLRKNKVGTDKFALIVEIEEASIEIVGPLAMDHSIITKCMSSKRKWYNVKARYLRIKEKSDQPRNDR